MAAKLGGSVECFYYCFGDTDVVAIIDVADPVDAVAISLAINSTGAVDLSLTPLLSPSDIDNATKKTVGYRAPGA